jgi:acylphosphatase
MSTFCLQAVVSGKVQGVGFRAATQSKARAIGIKGYAENLTDGRVKIVLCGERDKVLGLKDCLYQGPSLARVEAVKWQRLTQLPPFSDFKVK